MCKVWYSKKQRYMASDKCDTVRNHVTWWATSVIEEKVALQYEGQVRYTTKQVYSMRDKCDTGQINITISVKSIDNG